MRGDARFPPSAARRVATAARERATQWRTYAAQAAASAAAHVCADAARERATQGQKRADGAVRAAKQARVSAARGPDEAPAPGRSSRTSAAPRRASIVSLWEDLHIDEEHDIIGAVFTPEGAAFFRAWLRRRGVDPWCGTS